MLVAEPRDRGDLGGVAGEDDEIGRLPLLERVGAVCEQRRRHRGGRSSAPTIARRTASDGESIRRSRARRGRARHRRVSSRGPADGGTLPSCSSFSTKAQNPVACLRAAAPSTSRTRCAGSPARRTPRPASARRAPRRAAARRTPPTCGCRPATSSADDVEEQVERAARLHALDARIRRQPAVEAVAALAVLVEHRRDAAPAAR